jgi:hypothetical protein
VTMMIGSLARAHRQAPGTTPEAVPAGTVPLFSLWVVVRQGWLRCRYDGVGSSRRFASR